MPGLRRSNFVQGRFSLCVTFLKRTLRDNLMHKIVHFVFSAFIWQTTLKTEHHIYHIDHVHLERLQSQSNAKHTTAYPNAVTTSRLCHSRAQTVKTSTDYGLGERQVAKYVAAKKSTHTVFRLIFSSKYCQSLSLAVYRPCL